MPNLLVRIISAAVLLPPIVLLIIYGPPIAISGFMVLLAALAGFEFANITMGKTFPGRRFLLALASAAVCSSVSVYPSYPFATVLASLLIVPASFLLFMFSSEKLEVSLRSSVFFAFGAIYTGALFGCISLLHPVEPASPFSLSSPESDTGRWWIFLLLFGAVLSDTFAYAFGRLFGNKKLAPSISPGKTWAGSFGGVLGSMVCVLAAKLTLLPNLEWIDVALLGILLSVTCQLGDLSESFLKRGFSIKDSGKIIPGHGGILDRCDALMFGAPVVLLFSFIR